MRRAASERHDGGASGAHDGGASGAHDGGASGARSLRRRSALTLYGAVFAASQDSQQLKESSCPVQPCPPPTPSAPGSVTSNS
ncbi:hypothetical protein ARTHRO9V_20158 [Arthrobacter sp. 9V]|nr:hypothetical protein ARTHRO9V_20158 [Arthrobacter sp. 9V]